MINCPAGNLNNQGELVYSKSFSTLYGVSGIPDKIVVDQDGKVIGRNLRGAVLKDSLRSLFDF